MNEEYLDDDGYPTDEALKYIETFDWKEGDVNELFAFIKSIWNMYVWTESDVEDGRFNKINKYRRYEFSTGGWSGNEEIIRAFQRNSFLWDLCLESYRRGGHYVFDTKYVENMKSVKNENQNKNSD